MKLLRDIFGVSSPCVAVCRLEGEVCVGCGRTRAEIEDWPSLEQHEKRAVIERAAERRQRLGGRSTPVHVKMPSGAARQRPNTSNDSEKAMHQEAADLPVGYQCADNDPAENHIGPFYFRLTENGVETLFQAKAHSLNSGGSVHGGVLMTFIDYTLCVAAIGDSGESCVTVSCNSEFVRAAPPGALLKGTAQVVRRAGSMVFTRGEITADGVVVLTASAVVKRLRRRTV